MMGTFGTIAGLLVFLALLLGGLWIPFAIAAAGMISMVLADGWPSLKALGFVIWSSTNSSTLSCIPLFILMADVLLRSGVSDRFYDGLALIVRKLPGGLLQTNIAGCALFSAISGSSVATAASIAVVAVPKMKDEGYDHKVVAGSLAAGGTLGILIPPSIPMVIYSSFTEVSLTDLFIASMLPGIGLTFVFMAFLGALAKIKPSIAPSYEGERIGLRAYWTATMQIMPLIILIGIVLGTIYIGVATPTESAALGTIGSLAIAAYYKRLSFKVFHDSLISTIKVSAAVLFITLAAFVFAYGMEKGGVGKMLTDWVGSLELTKTQFLLVLLVGYAMLGCVVDSIGMIVLTVPLLVPILNNMGIDLLWFGIALVIVVELGQISPPLGINLFVIESIAKRGLLEVIRGSIPYYFLIVGFLVLMAIFPEMCTWPVEWLKGGG